MIVGPRHYPRLPDSTVATFARERCTFPCNLPSTEAIVSLAGLSLWFTAKERRGGVCGTPSSYLQKVKRRLLLRIGPWTWLKKILATRPIEIFRENDETVFFFLSILFSFFSLSIRLRLFWPFLTFKLLLSARSNDIFV